MAILTTHRRMMTIDGLSPASVMHAGLLGVAYRDKVLGYGPIAYWMLAEAAGVTAIDQVNSPAQDGTHVGVTLGQTGIGDGETCPLYDGINDRTNIYSVTFAGAFDGAEGTVLVWARVSGAGVWSDGNDRVAVGLANGAANRLRVGKAQFNNNLQFVYSAGGVYKNVTQGGHSDLDWMVLALTWSAIADEMKAYKNGAQIGGTQTGLGVWAGALVSNSTVIGDRSATIVDPWDGWLAHCAVWDTPLSGPDILDLSTL